MTEPPELPAPGDASFAGRLVVVLGESAGLVGAFGALGARVVVAGGDSDAAYPTLAAISAAGGAARFIQTDLDSPNSLKQLVAETTATFGVPWAVVLAPQPASPAALLTIDAADWEAVVERPLRQALLAAQAWLPCLLERGGGALVYLAAPAGDPRPGAQAAAHHGLLGLCQALAAEAAAHGVRVVALTLPPNLAPGAVAQAVGALLQGSLAGEAAVGALDVALADRHGGGAPQATSRAAHVARASALGQALADLLINTEAEFDQLPVAVRPMARGAFLSRVGYRSQDVLRAVNKLTDQLRRLQVSHSSTDTEFQVDYPLLTSLLIRLRDYYQAAPAEAARLTTDPTVLALLRRQMAARTALVHQLLASLRAVHD